MGKLNEGDEGPLELRVGTALRDGRRVIVIDFGKSAPWLGFGVAEARAIAAKLIDLADSAEAEEDPEGEEMGQAPEEPTDPDWSGLRNEERASSELAAILRDYQIEGDTCVRDIVARTTAAAVGFRVELEATRFALATLVSSLPRCQFCPNPATYSWHGNEELACDDHAPAHVKQASGLQLPYGNALRALQRLDG